MRQHVDHERHAVDLDDAATMIAKATEHLVLRPLSTTDVAWAKGCLERGADALGRVLEVDRVPA